MDDRILAQLEKQTEAIQALGAAIRAQADGLAALAHAVAALAETVADEPGEIRVVQGVYLDGSSVED